MAEPLCSHKDYDRTCCECRLRREDNIERLDDLLRPIYIEEGLIGVCKYLIKKGLLK